MKKYSDIEIKKFFWELLKKNENYSQPNFTIKWRGTDAVDVEVERMYDFVDGINFAFLVELGRFFETKDIDVDEYCSSTGCPTCGHYSSYTKTFQVSHIGSHDWSTDTVVRA